MPSSKKRLDWLAVERGLFADRRVATSAIIDGAVLVNGEKCTKPGTIVSQDSALETIPSWKTSLYVSRGGIKLEHALHTFQTLVQNRICLDIGASTGGFTDCLLQHGALKIYAIDVGYGQINWKLRQDKRVIVLERVNARYLSPQTLYKSKDLWADLAVIDVSFISVTKILEPCIACIKSPSAEIMCLIKPQFEAGKENVKKGGVIRAASTHLAVLKSIVDFASKHSLVPTAITYSPLKGPAGNIEFFLRLQPSGRSITSADLETTVEAAHAFF